MPRAGQETSCFLLETLDQLVMLDAGTGVANFEFAAEALARHDRLSILLSHYHLDHLAGLMYLKRFAAEKCVDVYGPGRPVYPKTTEEYARDLLQEAVYSSGPFGFAREVCYHDYGGRDFCVGDLTVSVRAQRHSAPSFELRLADLVTYATDTSFDPASWADCPPSRLLLHECWQLATGDPRHTSAEALVEGVPRERFGRVLLVHHNPSWDEAEREGLERLAADHCIELARDGMVIAL
jgi:ribonuclease BN (tRNA processing enzyme)